MHRLLDILASGVHDTKNQLFIAESRVTEAEQQHAIDLGEVHYAIASAANRLSQTLATYHLLRQDPHLAIVPVIVSDLCEEVVLAHKRHLADHAIALNVDCTVDDAWPMDRDLVNDVLNNAIQNAARHARQHIDFSVHADAEGLHFYIADDGPGFAELPPTSGSGLLLAERLANLHENHGRHGRLVLTNDGPLGGAVFAFHLP